MFGGKLTAPALQLRVLFWLPLSAERQLLAKHLLHAGSRVSRPRSPKTAKTTVTDFPHPHPES